MTQLIWLIFSFIFQKSFDLRMSIDKSLFQQTKTRTKGTRTWNFWTPKSNYYLSTSMQEKVVVCIWHICAKTKRFIIGI